MKFILISLLFLEICHAVPTVDRDPKSSVERIMLQDVIGEAPKFDHIDEKLAPQLDQAVVSTGDEESPASSLDEGFPSCPSLDPSIVKEIQSYQSTISTIINYIVSGQHRGATFQSLAGFVDKYGPRMSGTAALESSIDSIIAKAELDGFDAVSTESVKVPRWVRNSESATMVSPREQKLNMLGLGSSVGTPAGGIVADVLVVSSFEELGQQAGMAAGKIVVFNQPFDSYGQSVKYRFRGATEASKVGAVAALVRSVASFSIASPHTGAQKYQEGINKIPVACITVEDAKMLHRLQESGETVRVNLTMEAENLPDATSRNTLIDHRGRALPQDVVVIAGHVDSWDVGVGAMDDAGGCWVSYHANLVLKKLGLRPRRTVRTVWFTGEEQGLYGGKDYFRRHRNSSENYQILLESDFGTFSPKGIGFTGSDTATCIMQEIVKLTAAINTTDLVISNDGPDISMWSTIGVPIGSLHLDKSRYFWFHHSAGDSLDVEDTREVDRITALWAAVAYVTADISVDLKYV